VSFLPVKVSLSTFQSTEKKPTLSYDKAGAERAADLQQAPHCQSEPTRSKTYSRWDDGGAGLALSAQRSQARQHQHVVSDQGRDGDTCGQGQKSAVTDFWQKSNDDQSRWARTVVSTGGPWPSGRLWHFFQWVSELGI